MRIVVTNWPCLVDLYGTDKSKELLHRRAIEVSKGKTEEDWMHLDVPFDESKGEAIILFELIKRTKEFPSKEQSLRYEFRGSAN